MEHAFIINPASITRVAFSTVHTLFDYIECMYPSAKYDTVSIDNVESLANLLNAYGNIVLQVNGERVEVCKVTLN